MVKIHHPRPDRIHLHQSEGPPSSTDNRWSRPHRCWVGIQHNTRSFARHQGSPTTSPKQLKWRKKSLVSAKRDGNKQTNKQTKNVGFVIGIFPKFWGAPTPKNTFSTKATRAHDPKSKWCESYQIYSRLTKHNWIYRTNHLRCINDCKQWDVYLISTGKRSISEPSVQYYPLFTTRCCAAPGLSPCTDCRCSKNTRGSSEKKRRKKKDHIDISFFFVVFPKCFFVGFIFQSCRGEWKRWSFLGWFLDFLHSPLVSRPRCCFLVHSGRMPRRSQSGPQKKSLEKTLQGLVKVTLRKNT